MTEAVDVVDLAYIAGVLDSDGCITLKGRTSKNGQRGYAPKVFIRQVSDEAISVAIGLFGGSPKIHAISYAEFVGSRDRRLYSSWDVYTKSEMTVPIDDAVMQLGWSKQRLDQIARKKSVPTRKVDGVWYFPKEFIDTVDKSAPRLPTPPEYWNVVQGFVKEVRLLNGPTKGVSMDARKKGDWGV